MNVTRYLKNDMVHIGCLVSAPKTPIMPNYGALCLSEETSLSIYTQQLLCGSVLPKFSEEEDMSSSIVSKIVTDHEKCFLALT
jgi:hypothetical protein